jgi:hypothetical protein
VSRHPTPGDVVTPRTARRPATITPDRWARAPWHARVTAARRTRPPSTVPAELRDLLDAYAGTGWPLRHDEHPPDVDDARAGAA